MSEQHMHDKQEMNNPFMMEGLYYYGSGSLISIIGVIALLTLKKDMSDQQSNGWLILIISILLLTAGIMFIIKGFRKRSRFNCEKMSPLPLATKQPKSNNIFFIVRNNLIK